MTPNTGPSAIGVSSDNPGAFDTIICDLSAILESERAAHFGLARTILFADESVVSEIENGLAFDLPPERLSAVAAFLENERKCCRHLAFTLEIPPHNAALRLRVIGPGAREELRALAR
jgi:hypothetical protein